MPVDGVLEFEGEGEGLVQGGLGEGVERGDFEVVDEEFGGWKWGEGRGRGGRVC